MFHALILLLLAHLTGFGLFAGQIGLLPAGFGLSLSAFALTGCWIQVFVVLGQARKRQAPFADLL